MSDDELIEIERAAVDAAMKVAHARDGFAANMSRESIDAGNRALFNAGLMRAAEIARSMDGNEANGYYGQACHQVAGACETEAGKL